jgi:chorismate mutase
MKDNKLEHLRSQIDRIDAKIMKLLVKRYSNVELIGRIKKNAHLQVLNRDREQDILQKIEELRIGVRHKRFIKKIYERIFSASYDVEKTEY